MNFMYDKNTGEDVEIPLFRMSGNGRLKKPEMFWSETELRQKGKRNFTYGTPSQGAYRLACEDLGKWVRKSLDNYRYNRVTTEQAKIILESVCGMTTERYERYDPGLMRMAKFSDKYGMLTIDMFLGLEEIMFSVPTWVASQFGSYRNTGIIFGISQPAVGPRHTRTELPIHSNKSVQYSISYKDIADKTPHGILMHFRDNIMPNSTMDAIEQEVISEIVEDFLSSEHCPHVNPEAVNDLYGSVFCMWNDRWDYETNPDKGVSLTSEEVSVLEKLFSLIGSVRKNGVSIGRHSDWYAGVMRTTSFNLNYFPDLATRKDELSASHSHSLQINTITGKIVFRCSYEDDMEEYQRWEIAQAAKFLNEMNQPQNSGFSETAIDL